MSQHPINTKQIAKNTLLLYMRQILVMAVSLYTVRIVLHTLGAEDYGIYTLIAGIISIFSFISAAMASASQRFFAIAMGEGDRQKLKDSFSSMMTFYGLLCVVIIVCAETVGWWMVKDKLVLPPDRMNIILWVYQFVILSSVSSLLTAPYMAAIVAHENMNVYAYISLAEVVFKLLIVYLLQILPYDKLLVYGLLTLLVTLTVNALYRYYCHRYVECRFRFSWQKGLLTEIAGFVGWNFWGSFAWMAKNQGVSILFNLYYGPLLNAAQGVANQIRNVVQTFSQNFSVAVKPQITKSYAAKEYRSMFGLLCKSCKFTYFLMFVITLPLIYNLDFILLLWLEEVPAHVVAFTKLLLIESLLESISLPMATANQATGKIKVYQFLIGLIGMTNVPCAYFLLASGMMPEAVYVASILLKVFSVGVRFTFLRQIPTFNAKFCFNRIFVPAFLVTLPAFALCEWLCPPSDDLLTAAVSVCSLLLLGCMCVYALGLSHNERNYIYRVIINKIKSL